MNKWVIYENEYENRGGFQVQYHCPHYQISRWIKDENEISEEMLRLKKCLECKYCEKKDNE